MTPVECPECGERFEVEAGILVAGNRFYCSVCDTISRTSIIVSHTEQ